jgi:hypothetical protein
MPDGRTDTYPQSGRSTGVGKHLMLLKNPEVGMAQPDT